MLWCIRIIVSTRNGWLIMKTLYQHPFRIHIGKSERTVDAFHPFFGTPFFSSFKQCFGNFLIVNECNPSKTSFEIVPGFVGFVIDDCCNSSNNFSVFFCQEKCGIAKFKGGIFSWIKCVFFVKNQRWNPVFVVFIELKRKQDELLHFLFCFCFNYCNQSVFF